MRTGAIPRHVSAAAIVFGCSAIWAALLVSYSARDQELVMPLAGILAVALPIAFGLWRVKRAFFIGALIHAIAVIAIGTATAMFVEQTMTFVVAAIVQSALVAAFFLQPNVRNPFLRQRQGFRRHKRYEANLKASVELTTEQGPMFRTGETWDISLGGAYIGLDPAGLEVDMRIKVTLELRENKHLRVPARIASVMPDGFGTKPAGIGIELTSLSSYDRRTLDDFISGSRHHERMPVALPVSFERGGSTVNAETLDVSLSGCYVAGPHTSCTPGDRLSLTLMLHDGDPLELLGEVMWMSLTDSKGKPPGLAIQFMDVTRADKRRLEERLREAGVGDQQLH